MTTAIFDCMIFLQAVPGAMPTALRRKAVGMAPGTRRQIEHLNQFLL